MTIMTSAIKHAGHPALKCDITDMSDDFTRDNDLTCGYVHMASDSVHVSVAWMVAQNIKDTLNCWDVGYFQDEFSKLAVY